MSKEELILKTALKQLENAAVNLSRYCASTQIREYYCLKASQLVSQLRNAIEFGEAYPTESSAKAFDKENHHRK